MESEPGMLGVLMHLLTLGAFWPGTEYTVKDFDTRLS